MISDRLREIGLNLAMDIAELANITKFSASHLYRGRRNGLTLSIRRRFEQLEKELCLVEVEDAEKYDKRESR